MRVEFSDDSTLFLQCKRSVSLSHNPASEFGKAWRQFCQQVKSGQESNHPIRCILCYEEPNTALAKLREVFRRARQDSGWTKLIDCARTKQETLGARTLSQLHSKLLSAEPGLPPLDELLSAVHFHRLEVSEDCDSQVQSTEALQYEILSDFSQSGLAVSTLDTLGRELTTVRGLCFDIAAIRLRLRKAGVQLKDIPEFGPDLRELDAESKRTLEAFHHSHRDQLSGRFTLDRPVVDELVSHAAKGSLLVIGEPGAGKTGALMALAHKLKASRHRVWFLSAEGYAAESLPSLEKDLNLHHRLADLFGFAAEGAETVLLLDGLDAARGPIKQTTWRALVREANRRGIPVVATIRLFDLRHSQPWQELFPLAASEPQSNAVSGLSKVRFINVGELSDAELNRGLLEFPRIRELTESQPALRSLAKNIFNFNLLCQLADSGMPHNAVHTQLELLEAWWKGRVTEAGGELIEAALTILIERMVSNRRLQVRALDLEAKCIAGGQSVGLIRAVPPRPGYLSDDSVEFTHNVLFDYAAFRCFVLPKRDQLMTELAAPESWGLFLRPSLGHFFTWLWDNCRNEFWERAFDLQSASIPILHKTAMWFTVARSGRRRDDFDPILRGIKARGPAVETWLGIASGINGCGEAAVWKQLFRRSDGLWWVEYACDLLHSGDMFATNFGWQILYALYYEIEQFNTSAFPLINKAARLEVETHWAVAAPFGPGIKPCIWLFCRTISGNPDESAKLIRRMLTPEELALSGYYRGHEIAMEIVPIARCVPDLAVEIYEKLYAHREMNAEMVPMGVSAVMPMRMSRHDMYSSAFHRLQEGLTKIFDLSPQIATRAVCVVVCQAKGRTVLTDEPPVAFPFGGSQVQTTDFVGISYNFDNPFDEESRLLAAWRECLRQLPDSRDAAVHWKEVASVLVEEARPPEIWVAVLSAVPAHPEFFQDVVWPILHSIDLLPCWHFKKYIDPCVHALAQSASQGTLVRWQEIVLALRPQDLDRHNYPDNRDALEKLKSSYLLCLPEAALTDPSRDFLAQCKQENVRPYQSSKPHKPTPEERQTKQRRRDGVDPSNLLHLQLENDLASLTSPGLKRIGPGILNRISEVQVRFLGADAELQSRLRGQFQNGFSWALRALAQKATKLTDKQLDEMLDLCMRLLETNAGRENALEAIGSALSKRCELSKNHRDIIEKIVARPEPEVIERFGYYVWAFLEAWPEFVWDTLDRWTSRMGDREVGKALRNALHNSWFWWLFHKDKTRAIKLLEWMLITARQVQNTELADAFLAWFVTVLIDENDAKSREIVEATLSKLEIHGTELSGMVRVLVEWLVPRDPNGTPPADKLERASAVTQLFFSSAHKALDDWRQQQRQKLPVPEGQTSKEPSPWVNSLVQQFDHFAMELRFSAENHVKGLACKAPEDFKIAADAWWERAEPVLAQLEKWLHPRLGDHLIDALAAWFPYYPNRCLHWLRRICEAGMRTGLLFERLVVSAIVKIMQRCLTEHRDLLASDKTFLNDFGTVLESILSTANAEALGMAASLDEFYR